MIGWMTDRYGEWAGEIRAGFDAWLADDMADSARHYEVAAELGYEVAMHNAAWLHDNGYIEPTPATPMLPASAPPSSSMATGQHEPTSDDNENGGSPSNEASGEEAAAAAATTSEEAPAGVDFVPPTVRAQRLLLMALQ